MLSNRSNHSYAYVEAAAAVTCSLRAANLEQTKEFWGDFRDERHDLFVGDDNDVIDDEDYDDEDLL